MGLIALGLAFGAPLAAQPTDPAQSDLIAQVSSLAFAEAVDLAEPQDWGLRSPRADKPPIKGPHPAVEGRSTPEAADEPIRRSVRIDRNPRFRTADEVWQTSRDRQYGMFLRAHPND